MPRRACSRRSLLGSLTSVGVALIAGCAGRDAEAGRRESSRQPGTSTAETTTTTGTAARRPGPLVEVPPSTPQDEPVTLAIEDVEAGSLVTLEAAMEGYGGDTWSSTTTWRVPRSGRLDVGDHPPERGNYEGADPMGWLWSMTPEETDSPFAHGYDTDSKEVSLEVTAGGRRTQTGLELELNASGIEWRRIDSDELSGWYVEPPGDGPHPAVLLLHGSGGHPLTREARLLASNGYAAFALRYFGEAEAVPSTHDRIPLSYFDHAHRWLRNRDAIRDGPMGVLGVSRGGELALLLGARFDWVGAVVSYVGSGVVWEGGEADPPNPAWADDGDAVPYLEWKGEVETTDGGLTRFRPMVERRLDAVDDATLEAATIPVEETDAPILLISAGDDQVWASKRLSEIAAVQLRRVDYAHEFEHASYPDAGHFVNAPYVPTANRRVADDLLIGGTPAAYATADADSWPRVLAYLQKGLR